MPWYESQLAGTVIGAVLGFFLAYVPTAVERYRSRRALIHLLRTEIASSTARLSDKISHARRVHDAALQGRACRIFTSDQRLDQVFSANLPNLVWIRPEQAAKVFQFYQIVGKCNGLIEALSQDVVEEGDDSSEFCASLHRLIEMMSQGVSDGVRLAADLR